MMNSVAVLMRMCGRCSGASHPICHRRRCVLKLQHQYQKKSRCTNNLQHQKQNRGQCTVGWLSSISYPSNIADTSWNFRNKRYFSSDYSNPQRNYSAEDDGYYCEPEYLELVSQTAYRMREAVQTYIAEYNNNNRHGSRLVNDEEQSLSPPPIKLVGILATNSSNYENDTHGNERYSEQIAASCHTDGIVYEPWRVPPTIESLERAIHHANERLDVHGILVFYPVFDKLTYGNKGKIYKCQATGVYYRSMDDYFRDLVACKKDVEGYCRKGLRIQKAVDNEEEEQQLAIEDSEHIIVKAEELGPIYPCTALAVYKILESFHSSTSSSSVDERRKLFQDRTITIINRSEVLGLPLATMLSNHGATVYSINISSIWQFLPNGKVKREHSTTTVEQCVRRSSVIVSGVPSSNFQVPTEWIPKGSTVINVAAETNFDEETICDESLDLTYVPHVGRVTVAALEYNLICLHQNYHSK